MYRYKKVNMAEFIEELSELSVETQESVLKNLSDSMMPLEIDGNVFMVHKDVTDLIDNLMVQINNLEKERESKIVGKKNN
jgi:hypothetical protein|tara:strand:+ start:638 stop:877 length:240 start_codon:yes stop_codon:yes gene_type:complete